MLLLRQQYEYSFGINTVQFCIFSLIIFFTLLAFIILTTATTGGNAYYQRCKLCYAMLCYAKFRFDTFDDNLCQQIFMTTTKKYYSNAFVDFNLTLDRCVCVCACARVCM